MTVILNHPVSTCLTKLCRLMLNMLLFPTSSVGLFVGLDITEEFKREEGMAHKSQCSLACRQMKIVPYLNGNMTTSEYFETAPYNVPTLAATKKKIATHIMLHKMASQQ